MTFALEAFERSRRREDPYADSSAQGIGVALAVVILAWRYGRARADIVTDANAKAADMVSRIRHRPSR